MRHSSNAAFMHGFSALEGLTILLIVSILIATGIPPLNATLDRSRARSDVATLLASLNLARTHAIAKSTITTLCASNDGLSCGSDWSAGTLLFRDTNNNRQLDDKDQLIEVGQALEGGARLSWRASGRRNQYIRFSRHGMAMEFGTFTYCPASRQAQSARMLILNRMGRVRLATDRNGDGLVENHDGATPSC